MGGGVEKDPRKRDSEKGSKKTSAFNSTIPSLRSVRLFFEPRNGGLRGFLRGRARGYAESTGSSGDTKLNIRRADSSTLSFRYANMALPPLSEGGWGWVEKPTS